MKSNCAISREFEHSDQRRFHVPCPHCDHGQDLRWERVKWEKVTEDGEVVLDAPEGTKIAEHLPDTAHYSCEECNEPWTDPERWDAIRQGTWVATRKFTGVAGFHIPGFCSSWLTLHEIVDEFVKVKNDPALLQVWVNTVLGEAWEESGEKADATGLQGRAEAYDHQSLPAAVHLVTAGIDTQGDRLEVQLVGWGAREESWPCRYVVLHGDPAQPQVWRELDEVLLSACKTEDGRTLRVRAACIDSGGNHTTQVLTYAKSRRTRRVFPIKGMAGPRPLWPMRASRAGQHGNDQVFVLGVDSGKDAIYGRLRITEAGPGYVHFPAAEGFDDKYFAQLTSEQKVTRYREGRSHQVWLLAKGKRNEALDTFVYALAAFKSLSLRLERLPMPEVHDDGTFEHKSTMAEPGLGPIKRRNGVSPPAAIDDIDLGRHDLDAALRGPAPIRKRRSSWL